MKKAFCAASLFPSLLIASGMVFASSDGLTQLSDVGDSVNQLMQEQRGFQVKPPTHGEQPKPGVKPTHPGQPGNDNNHQQPHPQPPHPQPPHPQPPQPPHPPAPQPPAPVDTTHAYNDGVRDGSRRGEVEGQRQGHSDGVNQGDREGRWNGTNEGERAGRAAGKRDGWGVNQSAGTLNGSNEGENTGTTNGTRAGEKRCYDAGYASAYNVAYAAAKELGLKDEASYSAGYSKGQADATVAEAAKGQKAGYQAGFSQRETELENSFASKNLAMGVFTKGYQTEKAGLTIEQSRGGYATPEERQAYDRGVKDGYNRTYRRAYDNAKRDGYRETYDRAYRRAYDSQYSMSYRDGYAEGKEQGYQEAYSAAYNSAYSAYYSQYSSREYPAQRAQGESAGQATGQNEGFAAGCAEQTNLGYAAGYQATTAQVYPEAYAAGKQAGIAAADKYYAENSVLKVVSTSFYDENGNGNFEAGENIMMKAEIKNFGFQASDTVSIVVKSERGEVLLTPELSAAGVGARAQAVVNLKVGQLFDVVAPDADALYVTFSVNGKQVGDFRQMYSRTNVNKVGVVSSNGAHVRKGTSGIFSSTITKLDRGVKLIIIGEKNGYFKVRKSAFSGGDWTEGYINQNHVNLQ